MGVRFPGSGNNTIVAATIVTTAETVVATSNALSPALDFELIIILWEVTLTIGTTGNLLTPKLRRGTTVAGTLVNVGTGVTVVAPNVVKLSGVYTDTPGAVAGQQYSITLTVGAATANSTVSDVSIVTVGL